MVLLTALFTLLLALVRNNDFQVWTEKALSSLVRHICNINVSRILIFQLDDILTCNNDIRRDISKFVDT